ncbi:MAG: right-handed parallel beta-helix repeat-containing protein [Phycisphaeraceae bacterium]
MFNLRAIPLLLAVALLIGPAATAVADTVHVATRAELLAAVEKAQPGTTILLAPGDYGSIAVSNLHGAEGRPITIAGADPDDPPRFVGGTTAFGLSNPRHVVLENLIAERADVNSFNIDDGGTMEATASHITLRNVVARDVQLRGNRDGIKLSGVTDFLVENSTIERWGDGGQGIDMVGCHRGEIRNNVLRHDPGESYGTAITAKGGSAEILIIGNHFEDFGGRGVNIGGATGKQFFRPQPPGHYEARDITVTRNTFVRGDTAVAFVNIDGSEVAHNTIYMPRNWVFRILQETTDDGFVPSRNGVFANNLVVYDRSAMRRDVNVGPNTAPQTFTFQGNWWYNIAAPNDSEPDLPAQETGGIYRGNPQLRDPDGGDYRPAPQAPTHDAGAHAGQ